MALSLLAFTNLHCMSLHPIILTWCTASSLFDGSFFLLIIKNPITPLAVAAFLLFSPSAATARVGSGDRPGDSAHAEGYRGLGLVRLSLERVRD